jgi:CheY-like chemotaxis protein
MSVPTVRILWIDDDVLILDALRRIEHEFWSRGWEIVTACGGKMGLRLLSEEGPFAVVVTDLMMPEFGGADVLKVIRAGVSNTGPRGTPPEVAVIVCTAATPSFVESVLRKEGAGAEQFDGYLSAPLDFRWMLDFLARVIAERPPLLTH